MRKKWSGVMVAIAVLATGCGASVPVVSETVTEESGTAVEEGWAILEESLEAVRQEMESSLEEKEESLEAEIESIEEVKESLEAAEESLLAVEESLKEAEEAAGLEGRITYGQLTSSPAAYQQKKVSFSGGITRVARSGNTYGQLVVEVNGDASQKLVCEYDRSRITPPLAVGDQVQVNGVFTGLLQYRLASGSLETLPTMTVEEFGQIWRAVPETAAQSAESLFDPGAWAGAESPAAGTEGVGAASLDGTTNGTGAGAAIPNGTGAGATIPNGTGAGTTIPDGTGTGTTIPDGTGAGTTIPDTAATPTEGSYLGGPGMVSGQ